MSDLTTLVTKLETHNPGMIHIVIAPPFIEEPIGSSVPRADRDALVRTILRLLDERGIAEDARPKTLQWSIKSMILEFEPSHFAMVAAMLHILLERGGAKPEELAAYSYVSLIYDQDVVALGCALDRQSFLNENLPFFLGRADRLISPEQWVTGEFARERLRKVQ